MRSIRLSGIFALLAVLLLSSQCKEKETVTEDNFKKGELLAQTADRYILPSYQSLVTSLDILEQSWTKFEQTRSDLDFEQARNNWKDAYLDFQKVYMFDFGPAYHHAFVINSGTFPSDTSQIEQNIQAGNYDLGAAENYAAIGFAVLDYLLFDTGSLQAMKDNQLRRSYAKDIIQKLRQEALSVSTDWSTYRDEFVAGTGTSSTSPFSEFVNAYCKNYELAKNAKLGIPIGMQSLGIQRPEYLEARNAKFGRELLLQNLKTLKTIFLGDDLNGNTGVGFDDYLTALEKSSLSQQIVQAFDEMILEVENLGGDLEIIMTQEPEKLESLYAKMQAQVVRLKTDMSAAFGILITYQDNDGD
ncbi:MAG: hypothetical protein EP338_13215 [Bacteroidetes bacterium]|nr:MAG: hypothetical protein EP338_13215 [Bacteroidota bacterium]